MTIKLSCDAHSWETVYENHEFEGPNAGPTVIRFAVRRAKQIWIVAGDLQNVDIWGFAFSLGQVEVRDPNGRNLALASTGAGVTVSSTQHGFGMDRYSQDMLWPIQYDLGFKWTRVGYDMGMFLWVIGVVDFTLHGFPSSSDNRNLYIRESGCLNHIRLSSRLV